MQELRLHSVCQSAKCPNMGECWKRRTATFLILGDACTRHCKFCAVKAGQPDTVDGSEPERLANAVKRLGLRHAVVTSVTRDDLDDGGAKHFARTIESIRAVNPETTVEVLVPDFRGQAEAVETVAEAAPDVFGHNIETVRRLFGRIRDPRAGYDVSLEVLRLAARRVPVKSGLIVGLGESEPEVKETLGDVYATGCRAVTIGQYLRPGQQSVAVAEFVRPEQFDAYKDMALDMGFTHVMSGPFVRSSYHAEEFVGTRDTRAD